MKSAWVTDSAWQQVATLLLVRQGFGPILVCVLAMLTVGCSQENTLGTDVVDVHLAADTTQQEDVRPDTDVPDPQDTGGTDITDGSETSDSASDNTTVGMDDVETDLYHNDETSSSDAEIAQIDTNSGDVATDSVSDAAEPTVAVVAPADCPSLPAMCPSWRWDQFEHPFGDPGFQSVPGLAALGPTAWSRWTPVKLQQVAPHTVRLWATWFNQRNLVVSASDALWAWGKSNAGLLTGCMNLKPSLLPTGCVVLDISTQSHVVTSYQFTAKPGDTWPPVPLKEYALGNLGDLPVVACPGISNSAFPLPLQITASDGVVVRAHPGRADMAVLVNDAKSDPSALVRLDAAVATPGSVVEIALAATLENVPVDVSVCRATQPQIDAAGCACPTAVWPAGDVTPSGDYLRLQTEYGTWTLTPDFLNACEPADWSGQGYDKLGGSMTKCCQGPSGCPKEAMDWQCAGYGTQYGPGAFAQVGLQRTVHVAAILSLTPMPKPGTVSFAPNATFIFYNMLAPRELPARERDGAIVRFGAGGSPMVTVLKQQPNASAFVFGIDGFVGRMHGLAAPTKLSIDGHLTQWAP